MSRIRRCLPALVAVFALTACGSVEPSVVPTASAPVCASGAVAVGPDARDLQNALDTVRPGGALSCHP